MVHHCVVPNHSNNSSSQPDLSFHRLPLKNKSMLKVWVNKIGRKNLPLNGNLRVCSEHFINSTHQRTPTNRRLPYNEASQTANNGNPPPKRRSPRKRVCEAPSTISLLDDFVGEADTRCDGIGIGSNTSMTGADIENLLSEIAALKLKATTLKGQMVSLKLSLENIAFILMTHSGMPCFLYHCPTYLTFLISLYKQF